MHLLYGFQLKYFLSQTSDCSESGLKVFQMEIAFQNSQWNEIEFKEKEEMPAKVNEWRISRDTHGRRMQLWD